MKLHIYKENDKYVYKKRGVLSSQTILLYNQLKVIRSHLYHIHSRTDLSRFNSIFDPQGSKHEHFRTIHFGINYLYLFSIFNYLKVFNVDPVGLEPTTYGL